MTNWNWQVLRAGTLWLDGGGMFGVVPKALWARLVEPDAQNRIPLQTNCLLLEHQGRRVLIETGYGDKWSAKERSIFGLEARTVCDALHEADCRPDDIDDVVVSHLHFDHAAGLTRFDSPTDQCIPVFPNARIHVQRTEWDDANANKSTMTRTYLPTHLRPIADQVVLHDGEAEIIPGITVWPMPGHTWGQQAIRFDDGRGTVAFVGDVMPTIHHAGLAFSIGYDMLPYENMLSKSALLTQAHAAQWRIVIDHEPGPPVVQVCRDAERADRFTLQTVT